MNLLNLPSGINNIEQGKSLSEWAVEYISLHNFTRENFNSHENFRGLSRREKDAIRYQIRKGATYTLTNNTSPKKTTIPRSARKPQIQTKSHRLKLAKIGLGVWISAFLLIDIAQVYLTKGASPLMAWQSAILVELCIVCASMSTRIDLRRVAYALFTYNVLIFGFMEVDLALNKSRILAASLSKLASNEEKISTLNQQLNEQAIAAKDNLKRLGSSHNKGYITSGTYSFERVSRTLMESSEKIKSEILSLDDEVKNLQNQNHSPFWIWISAMLYFLLRCILQYFSIRLLEQNATD